MSAPKEADALKFGILGAARIAPNALIGPAESHPGVVIEAVAARDKTKAEKYAKQHGIPKVYSGSNGYQGMLTSLHVVCFSHNTHQSELLDDPDIDVIYNPVCSPPRIADSLLKFSSLSFQMACTMNGQ